MKLRAGTRIEFYGTPAMGGFPAVPPEQATITHWDEAVSGPRAEMPGWYCIRLSNGRRGLAHESLFRVIDNRD